MDEMILTVRARRLMKEIKRLRESSGLKKARVAKQLGIGESTLWRLETGKSRISPEVLVPMLELYGVRSPRKDALERLCLDTLRRGWWAPYTDVFSGSYVALESDASEIRICAFAVPGFWQTEDYARAVIAGSRPELSFDEVDRRMEARLARQKALFEDREAPMIHVLLDESAIRRCAGGPAVMRDQLHRLIEAGEREGTTIQVLPFAAGYHAGAEGEFVVIDFPDPEDDPFVYEEGLFGDIYLETPDEVARYRLAFDHATDSALDVHESAQMIATIAEEMA